MHSHTRVALLIAGVIISIALPAHASFKTLYSFTAAQGDEIDGVLQTRDGSQYISTSSGGAHSVGTILRRDRLGNLTVLHAFGGTDGANPSGAVALGNDGALYGTTSSGGASGYGTAFRLSTSGAFTVLHAFTIADGGPPHAALLLASDGNFYGTTAGAYIDNDQHQFQALSYGAIFRMSRSGSLTVLHNFAGASDGAQPLAALIQGSDGALYGTTSELENSLAPHPFHINWGTVFRVTSNGTFSTLHAFAGTDGGNPRGALVQDASGKLYGISGVVSEWQFPGGPVGVFSVTLTGSYVMLPAFLGDTSSVGEPVGELVLAADGSLYGTSHNGGANALGTFFRIASSGDLSVLHSFTVAEHAPPSGVLIANGTSGDLLGATRNTLFSISKSGSVRTLARDGYVNGAAPSGALTLSRDGNFYGTTTAGGAYGYGTVFRLTSAGALTVIYSFQAAGDPNSLLENADGNLYGTLFDGGPNGLGTIFRVTRSGSFSTLYTFDQTHSYFPSGLLLGDDGAFYGLTSGGGTNGTGSFFRFDTDGTFTTVRDLQVSEQFAHVTRASDGNFYGTRGDGAHGEVFRLTPDGVSTTLHTFDGSDGSDPDAALVQGRDGNLYGATDLDGANGAGTLFRISTAGDFKTLFAFPSGGPSGLVFGTALAVDDDGSVYGDTLYGSANGKASLFRLTPSGALTTLQTFDSTNVRFGSLVRGKDGGFYGGIAGEDVGGSIYRLDAR